MKCTNCGDAIEPGMVLCENCGHPPPSRGTWMCPSCRETSEAHFDLCWNCQAARPADVEITAALPPERDCGRCGVALEIRGSTRLPLAAEPPLEALVCRCPKCGRLEFFAPPS